MKNLLIITILFASLPTFAQNLSLTEGTTRAVIIGISDYQNEDIPDLRFADKDAQAFATYLQSPAGGKLPMENIKVLLNEKATMAAIASELDWLVEESNEGDQAIIYFSGHGDVEAKTARQPGFLLTYDSPPKIYIAGAYPLFYLQLMIETLSSDKNVQTLVITDACRAGKLAGSEIGGTQATASNLAKQYANEIKILSCQPNEFSLEGEQWGGGRGAFSYHLIEGLIGLADKNDNMQVNLLELENYLEEKVPEETAPQSQIPMTVGSKGTAISFVDSEVLAELKDLKKRELPALAAIESRGIEETLLSNVDSLIQIKYDDFIAALNDENLLDSENGKPSADELYRALMKEESLADLHRFMTRQYATALQDDAQQVINAYLLANPTEMEKRWEGDTTYGRYPRYLDRAAELLGKDHYIYNYLIAKKLYFEGLNLRLQGDQVYGHNDQYFETLKIYSKAKEKQMAAIELEDRAAYFYNELGVLNTRLKKGEEAKESFEKAIELAPEWGLPYVNYSVELFYNGEYEKAIENGEKALKLLPHFPQMYNFLAWIYANDNHWMDKQNWLRSGAELSDDIFIKEFSIASYGQNLKRYEKGIELLEKAKAIDSTYYNTFLNLGAAYLQTKEYQKAEIALKKAIELNPENQEPYYYLGRLYFFQNRPDEGIVSMLRKIELAKTDGERAEGYNSLQWGYGLKGDRESQIAALKKAIDLAPSYFMAPYSNLSNLYNNIGEYEKAETTLLDALQIGPPDLFVFKGLGRTYDLLNRPEDAEYLILKGLEIKPDYISSLSRLLKIYIKSNQFEKAIKVQKSLMDKQAIDVESYFALARIYYLANDRVKTEENFEKAIQLNPNRVNTYDYISWYYWMHGDYEKATTYIQRAKALEGLEVSPASDTYWHQSWVLFDNQKLEEALAVLEEAAGKYPKESRFYEMQFFFNYWSGKFAESKAAATKHRDKLRLCTFFIQVAELMEKEDYENAIVLFEKMTKEDKWNINTKYSLVRLNTRLGNYDRACEWLKGLPNNHFSYHFVNSDSILFALHSMKAYHESLRRPFPEKYYDGKIYKFEKPKAIYYLENCITLAKYYEGQGEAEKAKFLCKKAIELIDTLSNESAMNLAEVYLKLNMYEEAIKICPDHINSEDAEKNFSYALLYYQLNQFEKAEAHFQKYAQLDKNNSYRFQRIANQYYLIEEKELTEKYLRKAMEIDSTEASPYIVFAVLNYSFGNYETSIQAAEEGIKKFPSNIDLKVLKAFFIGLSNPAELSNAFQELEPFFPNSAKLVDCINLMNSKQFEAATLARKEIQESFSSQAIIILLEIPYVRMLCTKKDFNGAMEIIEKYTKNLFSYQFLKNDPALAPLWETEQFKAYLQKNYPGKVNR